MDPRKCRITWNAPVDRQEDRHQQGRGGETFSLSYHIHSSHWISVALASSLATRDDGFDVPHRWITVTIFSHIKVTQAVLGKAFVSIRPSDRYIAEIFRLLYDAGRLPALSDVSLALGRADGTAPSC